MNVARKMKHDKKNNTKTLNYDHVFKNITHNTTQGRRQAVNTTTSDLSQLIKNMHQLQVLLTLPILHVISFTHEKLFHLDRLYWQYKE